MDVITILKYIEAAVAVGIIISVVLQNRSGGLGAVLGGSGGGEAYRSKRGLEGLLYNSTIILGVVFAIIALAIAILSV